MATGDIPKDYKAEWTAAENKGSATVLKISEISRRLSNASLMALTSPNTEDVMNRLADLEAQNSELLAALQRIARGEANEIAIARTAIEKAKSRDTN